MQFTPDVCMWDGHEPRFSRTVFLCNADKPHSLVKVKSLSKHSDSQNASLDCALCSKKSEQDVETLIASSLVHIVRGSTRGHHVQC